MRKILFTLIAFAAGIRLGLLVGWYAPSHTLNRRYAHAAGLERRSDLDGARLSLTITIWRRRKRRVP
jgi:hypothetical protein